MSKAFIKDIDSNGNDVDEQGQPIGVHNHSPAWVLTFVRWSNRFPYEYKNEDPKEVRRPFVVENDCISITTQQSKSTHTPSAVGMLKAGDIAYDTAVAPGDFMFVNMLRWPDKAREVADRARNNQNINREEDGFRGVYKVQSVRRVLANDPATGVKRLMFQVQAFAHTEFNNTIYFNPFLLTSAEKTNDFLFITRLSDTWEQQVGKENVNNVQDIIKILINSCIGVGPSEEGKRTKGILKSPNTQFIIPKLVGQLLGVPVAESAKDVFSYLFGVQQYSKSGNVSLASGMNPVIARNDGRYLITNKPCSGNTYLKAEYWNQVTLWSILNQFSNSPINELYTCFRIGPSGRVMPTVVFRQIPFSSEKYSGTGTKFLSLPRWRISPNLLTDINLGREEAARINFVQVFGKINQFSGEAQNAVLSDQIGRGNYRYDLDDIRRNGLRPYIVSSNFDLTTNKNESLTIGWVNLLADALIGGHLKTNGSIESIGIQEPIAPGDNLELDGVVYHIESVTHTCSNAPGGKKIFRTRLELSHGIDLRSDKTSTRFPSMDEVDIEKESIKDNQRLKLLPGFSDEQAAKDRLPDRFGQNTTKSEGFFQPPGTKAKAKPDKQKKSKKP